MAEQPSDDIPPDLLQDLKSDDPQRRRAAADTISAQKIADPRLVSALQEMAADPSNETRQAAEQALTILGHSVPSQVANPTSAGDNARDFLLGLMGWFVVNIGLWVGIWAVFGNGEGLLPLLNVFILPVNLLILIILTFRRSWVALGMLTAYAVNFGISLLMGLVINGWCWIPFTVQ